MIIGISGKIGSGKDTVGEIIRYLIYNNSLDSYLLNKGEYPPDNNDTVDFEKFLQAELSWRNLNTNWQIKKFADKLKDIVCLLIGCTREQLEDQEFKNKELGEEWWYYKFRQGITGTFSEKTSWKEYLVPYEGKQLYDKNNFPHIIHKLTPRKLLQTIGTNLFRNQLHPNTWINATFADYKKVPLKAYPSKEDYKYPKWIITDCRFPNEAQAVKDRDGLLIRVNRPIQKLFNGDQVITKENKEMKVITSDNEIRRCKLNDGKHYKFSELRLSNEHPSETSLDKYSNWDYVIENNGTIEDLIVKVKEILIKEKII